MLYVDNKANNDMYGDKDKFMDLDESIKGNIIFVYHSKVFIKEKGMILIQMKDSNHQFIGDVHYISTIKCNILSLRQLMDKGYEIKMKDRILTLLDTHRTMIAKVTMTKNMMFFLHMEINMSKCLKTCVKYQTWLWHIKLKQVNFDSLKMMM